MADKTRKATHTTAEIDAAVDMLLEMYTRDEIDGLLAQKVNASPGMGLSKNNFTDADKSKLDSLENYDDTDIKNELAEVNSALEEIRELVIENGGINFLGETSFSNSFRLISDFSKAKVSTPDSGTLSSNEGIFMMITPDYDSYQNWEYKIQVTFTGDQSYPICMLGSKGDYFSNPTMEIPSSNVLWFGVTRSSSSWDHSVNITTDEPFTSGTTYDLYLGWDGAEIYCKIYNADTNTLIGLETIAAATNPQRNPNSGGNPCILNNGDATRFRFLGTVNLMECYFKANDEILWGRKNNSGGVT